MTCFECDSPGPLHQHHVIPRSRGGTRTVPLCEDCHGVVHGKDLRISALTSAALRRMRDQGLYTGGRVPYGWRLTDDGELVEDHGEQLVIAAVREYRAEGLSLRATAARLADRGLMPRSGRNWSAKAVSTVEKARA